MLGTQKFEVKWEHLALLERAYVGWNGCEFGAPSMDCKRPYGNSDVFTDIGEILNIEGTYDEEEEYTTFSDEQQTHMRKIHEEMKTVLQILFVHATTGIRQGLYESERYGTNWKLKYKIDH